MTTNGYKYLTLNLAQSLKTAGVPWKLCVICVDRESAAFLRGQGVDCIVYSERIPSGQMSLSQISSDSFHRITKLKLAIMDELISNSDTNTVVYMDGDIVVKKDFLPWVHSNIKSGVWVFQCDENSETACSSFDGCPNFCTGFIVYKKDCVVPEINPFRIDTKLWNDCKQNHDQEYVQRRIRELGFPFETLERHLFPNGKMIKHATDPFLRHYNYRVGSSKQTSMKQRGDWLIPY
jgi:hypothetical protein